MKSNMQSTIPVTCPQEILLGLHMDVQQFATLLKEQSAMALFREGRLSSGMAASWLGVPRAHFLIKAMQEGATLLENTQDDFRRETALL
jgi:predicted HTH domain antitoxin